MKTPEILLQREILGKLVPYSYRNNAYIDVENFLKFLVAPACLVLDGTISKTCKSMLFDTTMSDTTICLVFSRKVKTSCGN